MGRLFILKIKNLSMYVSKKCEGCGSGAEFYVSSTHGLCEECLDTLIQEEYVPKVTRYAEKLANHYFAHAHPESKKNLIDHFVEKYVMYRVKWFLLQVQNEEWETVKLALDE